MIRNCTPSHQSACSKLASRQTFGGNKAVFLSENFTLEKKKLEANDPQSRTNFSTRFSSNNTKRERAIESARAKSNSFNWRLGIFNSSRKKNNATECLSEAVREVGAVAALAVAEAVCPLVPFCEVLCCWRVLGRRVTRGGDIEKMNWSLRVQVEVGMTSC